MSASPSDSLPLDAESPLTKSEVLKLRQIIRDDDRRSWAAKKLRVLVPLAVGVVVTLWQLWDWIAKHWKYTP